MGRIWLGAIASLSLATGAHSQTTAPFPDFRPVLHQVEARSFAIDPARGYVTKELKPGVFMITDGGYQAMFVPTGKGVVLFDAPPSFAAHIVQAVAEITREPIVTLVYSHGHVDHIGGAGVILKARADLQIVAEQGTADFLAGMHDPDRPMPTQTFRDHEVLRVGTLTADLKVGHWHSPSGDLLIELPAAKVLMAVDAFSAGSVPFMGLDLSQDLDQYRRVFDDVLARDWDVIVPGHHSNPATRDDVRLAKAYVDDVLATATLVVRAGDPALVSAAVRKYGNANSYAVARVLIDHQVDACAAEIDARWKDRLNDVDVFGPSHCRTALVWAEWDVGPHGRPD